MSSVLGAYHGIRSDFIGGTKMIDETRTLEIFGYVSDDLTKHSHKKVVFVCEQCGRYRVGRKHDHREICKSCAMGNRNIHYPKHRIKIICAGCGKESDVILSLKNRKFCSLECAQNNRPKWTEERKADGVHDALQQRHQKGEGNPNWKRVKVVCEICGEFFYRPRCKMNNKYCSYKCRGIAWRGENNPMWIDGSAQSSYCSKFNETFKEKIRARFGRMCFICGKTEEDEGKKLAVHHVNYDKSCLCDDIKCEFVPLCHRCHARTNTRRGIWENLIMNVLYYMRDVV